MNIRRIETGARMSQAVVHGDTVYLSGQVGTPGASVQQQTQEVLSEIDSLLSQAGSHKSRILSATIWLSDIADFEAMNAVWDNWVDKANAPARATSEARLAAPGYAVEIVVTAACRRAA